MSRLISNLALAAALVASYLTIGAAHAGGVYRCTVDGVPTFTNKAMKGRTCKAMAHAPSPPSRPYIPVFGSNAIVEKPNRMGEAPALPAPNSAPGQLPPLPPISLPIER